MVCFILLGLLTVVLLGSDPFLSTNRPIVAEVLVQLARLTEDNFLDDAAWRPRIPTAAPAAERKVMLADLLRFAQVVTSAHDTTIGIDDHAADRNLAQRGRLVGLVERELHVVVGRQSREF